MKKILIFLLSALGAVNVGILANVSIAADNVNITSLDDLIGKEITFKQYLYGGVNNDWIIEFNFSAGGVDYEFLSYNIALETYSYDSTSVCMGGWLDEVYQTILVSSDTRFRLDTISEQQAITFFNDSIASISTPAEPEPEPSGNIFTALIAAIGTFIGSVFGIVSDVFTGVVSIFYSTETGATVLLQALALGAAATLAGVGIYVIVRLIKGAIARTRGATGSITKRK